MLSALVPIAPAFSAPSAVVVAADRSAVLNTFDERFASVTHDIQDFIGFNIAPWDFDWADSTLQTLLSALAPFVVRAGGTWEDGIFWESGPRSGVSPRLKPQMQAHVLTEEAWRPFSRLLTTQLEGAELVVGLGALWRHWNGCSVSSDAVCPGAVPWDSSNAAAFIRADRAAGNVPLGYELGNEPAVWNWTWGTPIVTPLQHSKDYAVLRAAIAEAYSDVEESRRPKVFGPDTTWGPVGDEQPGGGRAPAAGKGGPNYDCLPPWRLEHSTRIFDPPRVSSEVRAACGADWNGTLQHAPDIDAATFHYYGMQPGIVTSWKDFVAAALDGTVCTAVAAHARDLASSPLAGKVPLWLGEGGMTYGGFTHNVKGDNWLRLFGGGLSYLENLGCAASNGAQLFMRQQLTNFINGTRLAAADAPRQGSEPRFAYTPQPAWWVAVLWKKLVGTRAFSASVSGGGGGGGAGPVHAFAFDGKADAASTVVVLVNWDLDTSATRRVEVHGCTRAAQVYALAPAGPIHGGDDDKQTSSYSIGVAVNGREAKVGASGAVPPGALEPASVRCAGGGVAVVELAGLAAAFVVL